MIYEDEILYYDQGFIATKIPNNIYTLLWNEIYSTIWIKDSLENIYSQVPEWYQSELSKKIEPTGEYRRDFERAIGKDVLSKAPASLIDIGHELIKSSCFEFFKKYYIDVKLMSLDLWNGSEEIPYHFDTINGADTLVLIYLTDQESWKPEWGGQISLKKQVKDTIIVEQTFDPCNGTMLIINNSNPLITHKVRAMTDPNINRYTVSFNYKWT